MSIQDTEANEFDYDKYALDDDVRDGVDKLELAHRAKAKAQGNDRRAARKRKAFEGGCV